MTTPAERTASPRRHFLAAALLLMLSVAVLRGVSPFFEPDIWWHLRVGEHILQSRVLYGTDPWADLADKPYLATQWLPEAVAALLYRFAGMAGVLWLRAMVILAITVCVYLTARRLAGRLPSTLAAALAVLGAGASLNPRPQILSFLFFAVVVYAWTRIAADHQPRWWLVPLFWLWACSHALWAFGVALGLAVTLGVALDSRAGISRAALMRLVALNATCLGVVALTPVGPRLLLAPLQVANNAAWIAEEWRATPVNNAFAIVSVSVLVVTALLWARAFQIPPLWQMAVLIFAGFCTLWMWRLVPLGSIAAAPMLASAMQQCLPMARETFDGAERRLVSYGGIFAAMMALVLCATDIGAGAARYPGTMTDIESALQQAPAKSVVYADFGVSGWLLWRHPDLVPAADLRMEIYSADHLRSYIAAGEVRPGWQDFFSSIGARYAVVETDSALGDALQHRLQWVQVASSPKFILLTAPGAPTS